MMRQIVAAALGLSLLCGGGALEAKKKKSPPAGEVRKPGKSDEKPPAPGDKGVNEGASGRKNATEDAARAAESPTNDRRP